MIEDPLGDIDYAEEGSGPTIVFVPGSWDTRAAWRGMIPLLRDRFRIVTTSLLGYGGTKERRTTTDTSIDREAEIVEAVVRHRRYLNGQSRRFDRGWGAAGLRRAGDHPGLRSAGSG